MIRRLLLVASHLGMLAVGFALGVYFLPILAAPSSPTAEQVQAATSAAIFKGRFDRTLKGSDYLHWGEGDVHIARDRITHTGRLAPGPDYRLYLATSFVDTKEAFLAIKSQSVQITEVKAFNGFIAAVPSGVDITTYTTVVIWCEAFSQFITATKYR
jgi:Electron transfer DM13